MKNKFECALTKEQKTLAEDFDRIKKEMAVLAQKVESIESSSMDANKSSWHLVYKMDTLIEDISKYVGRIEKGAQTKDWSYSDGCEW